MEVDTEQWPPKSPMKTLLSSPSGRKKYREYQELGLASTSPNKLLGSPSLLEKLRAARANRDHDILPPQNDNRDDEDEDEDEETLQLKLQAIQAKLKLKRLHQQRARDAENTQPQTSQSAVKEVGSIESRVEVTLSPTKRSTTSTVQKSPSRVLLGIDKGLSAADVSLRRARTIRGSPTKKKVHHVESQTSNQSPSIFSRAAGRQNAPSTAPAKSFSERMAEMRDHEKDREKKSSVLQQNRSLRFKVDKQEMASYHSTSEQQSEMNRTVRQDLNSDRENRDPATSRQIKHSHSMPSLRSRSPVKSTEPGPSTSTIDSKTIDGSKGDPSLYEGFSGTHLSSRILPHSFLKRTLPTEQFSTYTIPKLLKEVISPDYQISDSVTDYVVFGIIASMSSPLDHKSRVSEKNSMSSAEWEKKWDDGTSNRQKFIVVTLTDLKWTLDLYLFETAVPRYHRLSPGTLIAILNPGIMPPKKGREDTGAFSLAIHDGEDQVLEIGKARYLSHCTAKKKDGNECGSWVDGSKTETCEYHLNAQIDRARSGRSGLNSMDSWQKSNSRGKPRATKQGFDYESQTFYYAIGGIAPKKPMEDRWSYAPTHNANVSTARLLDASNPDDPFLAEGQMLERDKQDRLRKRMAAMQKEHEIAKKLAKFNGSAGGQYMRQRTDDPSAPRSHASSKSNGIAGPGITKEDILADRTGDKRKKRTADSVRLSPVKKRTRFLTEKGIRVAGRESIGHGSELNAPAKSNKETSTKRERDNDEDDDDDDDDDLDIV